MKKVNIKRVLKNVKVFLKTKIGMGIIALILLVLVCVITDEIHDSIKINNAIGDLQYMQISVCKKDGKGKNKITKTYYFEDNHVYYQKEGKNISRYYSVSDSRIQKLNKKIENYILGKPDIKEGVSEEDYIYNVLYLGNQLYVYDESSYILPNMDLAKDIEKVLK